MSFVAGKSDRHCRELGPACGQALGSTAGTCTAGGLSGLQPAASPQFTHAAIFHRLDQPGVPPGAVPFHLLHHHPLPQHPGLHTGPGPQPGAPASPPHPTQHRRAASPAAAPPPAAPGGSSGRGADVCHTPRPRKGAVRQGARIAQAAAGDAQQRSRSSPSPPAPPLPQSASRHHAAT